MASQKHLIFATLAVIWRSRQHPGQPVVLMHHLRAWRPDPAFSSPVAPVSFHLLPSPPWRSFQRPRAGPQEFGAYYFLQTSVGLCIVPTFPAIPGD